MIPADSDKATIEEVCDENNHLAGLIGEYKGVEVGEGLRRKAT